MPSKFKTLYITIKDRKLLIRLAKCYGPNVISVTVTKGGHPRGNGLYGTSKTIRRGVS